MLAGLIGDDLDFAVLCTHGGSMPGAWVGMLPPLQIRPGHCFRTTSCCCPVAPRLQPANQAGQTVTLAKA